LLRFLYSAVLSQQSPKLIIFSQAPGKDGSTTCGAVPSSIIIFLSGKITASRESGSELQGHKIVSRAGDAIGINYVFGLHSLRKTFGYQYIKNGGKPETLMKMYNHDDYDYTKRYVHWGIEDAEQDREAMYIGLKRNKIVSKK